MRFLRLLFAADDTSDAPPAGPERAERAAADLDDEQDVASSSEDLITGFWMAA